MSANLTTKTQPQSPPTATEAADKTATKSKTKSNSGPFPDLSIKFSGIELKNPVIAASGTFGYGLEFEDIVRLEKLRGFLSNGLRVEHMHGTPPPRIFRHSPR